MKLNKKDQNTYESLKYKWEFLRRNPDYKKRYEEILIFRKKHNYKPGQVVNFLIASECEEPYTKERKICTAFGISAIYMPNPNLSFDELINKNELSEYDEFLSALNQAASMLMEYPITSKSFRSLKESGKRTLEIDFSKINSLKSTMDEVRDWLICAYEFYKEEVEKSGEKVSQKYKKEYELYLTVGKLKDDKKITVSQIAKELFPNDFDEKYKSASPENAIRKTRNYYKSYKDLIHGRYKARVRQS